MILIGTRAYRLGVPQDNPTKQEMPQTVAIHRGKLNTKNK